MDWSNIISSLGPLCSGAAALVGILISNKLTTYRIELLEKHLEEHNSRIEGLLISQSDIGNIKNEIDEFKAKEDKDRAEIREDIEKLQDDVGTIKGQVGELQVHVTKLEGEVDTVKTLVKVHHG